MCTKKERILQKLNPTLLRLTPKLSGDAGSFVDLDSGDSLEDGAKKLMMRFLRNQDLCEKNKRNSRKSEEEVTISSAKYNENEEICELITERLTLPLAKSDPNETSERPGRRLQNLKIELQEKMSAKWEEEYKKRISEKKSFEIKHKQRKKKSHNHSSSDKQWCSEADDEDDADEKFEVESCDKGGDAADDESEEEENKCDGVNMCNTTDNSESNGCESNKGKSPERDDECDDIEACSLVPAYQPGGGLLYGGSELTQGDEGLPQNLLSPSLSLSMTGSPGFKLPLEFQSFSETTPKKKELISSEDGDSFFMDKHKLFSQDPNNSFDLSDAFEFCSGKFPDTNSLETENQAEGNSNASDDDSDKFEEDNDGEEEQDSFEEASIEAGLSKARKNIITFEDSEEEEEDEEHKAVEKETENNHVDEIEEAPSALNLLSDDESETAAGKSAKSRKKTRKSLHFSDEEDAANDCECENDRDDLDGLRNSGGTRGGDEDLEKDEECDARSVHYDSEENEIINPKEFFEKEAELSGSEWSGDEDERGLDEFDVEEGDADNLDSSQVRSQLEKIHIRRVLNDDAREVRLIQEILFEDGDLHSDGKRRDRKFKWKNLGTFEEQGNDGKSKEEAGNSSEDDCAEEEEQRKLRYEKELFLMTKKQSGDVSSDDEITADFEMVKVTRIKASGNCDGSRTDRSKAITNFTEVAKNSLLSNARGSFLTRNEEFLSRLAKATSSITDNVSGPKHSRNFVFTTKSPEKTNPERNMACKRQVEDPESCGRLEKRMKVSPPKVDAGPSILDLLV